MLDLLNALQDATVKRRFPQKGKRQSLTGRPKLERQTGSELRIPAGPTGPAAADEQQAAHRKSITEALLEND